jgi:hypothetical protein
MDHQILDDLPAEQQALVDIIGRQWSQSSRWPVLDWVNRVFRRRTGLEALDVIFRLPTVVPGVGGMAYGLVFSSPP